MVATVHGQRGFMISAFPMQLQAAGVDRCTAVRAGELVLSLTSVKAVAKRRRALFTVTLETSKAATGPDDLHTAAVIPEPYAAREEEVDKASQASCVPESFVLDRSMSISARSSFKTMAGALAHTIRRGGVCQVQVHGYGSRPLSRTLQVLSTAKLMLRDRGDMRILINLDFAQRSSVVAQEDLAGTEPLGRPFGHLIFHVQGRNGSALELMEEERQAVFTTFRVRKSTDPVRLSFALWYAIKEGRRVVVECVALGALEKVFLALSDVRTMLHRMGLMLLLDPEVAPMETPQGRARGYKLKLETKSIATTQESDSKNVVEQQR